MTDMLQTITLRSATPADAVFLLDLYCESRRDEVAAWGWSPEQQGCFLQYQFEMCARDYAAQHPTAEDQIVCMGTASIGRVLTACEDRRLFLLDMALLERYCNRGIGGALLEYIITRGRAEARTVSLQAVTGSRTERLCRRLGFQERCRDSLYVRMERQPTPAKQLLN